MYIYNAAGTLTGTLTGFSFLYYGPGYGVTENIAVDTSGNLYVADFGNHAVEIYAPPYRTRTATLADDGGPQGVAVDRDGNVAAANLGNGTGLSSVYFYAKGATKPGKVVNFACEDCELTSVNNVAFDGLGNLYFNAEYVIYDSPYWALGEIKGGIKNRRGFTVLGPGSGEESVQVTMKGLIAFDNCSAIYTYDPPVNGKLGKPVETTPLSTYDGCTFAFTPTNRFALTANNIYNSNATIFQYEYPAGGSPVRALNLPSNVYAGGVAVNPPAVP